MSLFLILSVFAVPNAWRMNTSISGYGIYNYNLSTTIPQLGISGSGNIGIGLTSSNQKLTVVGNVNATKLIANSLGACTGRLRSTTNGTIFCDNLTLGDITDVNAGSGITVTGSTGPAPSVKANFVIVANKSWVSTLNSTLVHISGTETVTGIKTFSASTKVTNNFNATNYYIGNVSLKNCAGKLYTNAQGKFLCGVDAGTGAVTGAGVANYLAYWNGASSLTYNTYVYTDGRKLGFGTTAPNAIFHLINTSDTSKGILVNMTNSAVGSLTYGGYFITNSDSGYAVYGVATKTGSGLQARGGYYAIGYTGLIPVLTEALKEQQQMIISRNNTIVELSRKVDLQQKQIDELKKLVSKK